MSMNAYNDLVPNSTKLSPALANIELVQSNDYVVIERTGSYDVANNNHLVDLYSRIDSPAKSEQTVSLVVDKTQKRPQYMTVVDEVEIDEKPNKSESVILLPESDMLLSFYMGSLTIVGLYIFYRIVVKNK
jgi:capsular polysaccharide biosynthesis protein